MEEIQGRSAEPTKPDQAAELLSAIQARMPALLAAFEKAPASRRAELDRLETRFIAFMASKRDRALTARERRTALGILGPAREHSRAYYNRFRDFSWERLNKDKVAGRAQYRG